MKKLVGINPITLFLTLFIVLVGFVFYYSYKISDDVQNYNVNHDNIASMKLLNQGIDYATTSFNQLSNYNVLNKDVEDFETLLKKLQANLMRHYPKNNQLKNYLGEMKSAFIAKVDSIEYFKSLNASFVSGSSFLFDLQRAIAQADDISYKTKSIVNETMFYLFEFHSAHTIEKIFIEKKLQQLYSVVTMEKSQLPKTFYKQANVLFTTMASFNILSEEIQNNQLIKQLHLLHSTLDKYYEINIMQEKTISEFTFLAMVVIWVILILLYVRSRINQKMLRQHASVFEHIQEAIVITDSDGNILSINKAFSSIYGYKLEDIKGKTLNVLKHGIQDEMFYKDMWHKIKNNGIYQGRIINKTKDGEDIPVWMTIKAVYNQSQEIINYISVQTDLRAMEASKNKAEYLAYHDTLTGLYNRTSFEEFLERSLLVAQRDKTKFAVLFIDLDRFKIINDTLGHDIGDKVLIQAAKRLESILRKSDVISRWGGDEFVVILHNVANENQVATVAQKIVEEMKAPIQVNHHSLNVTASVGIAVYPENAQDAQTLIKYADSAMYQVKEGGKNNFYFYTSILSGEIQERLQIDLALQHALDKNEIYMVFQPQYSFEDKKIVAVEALVRWESDLLGLISPDKFIPIAEENSYIITLGYFIFEEACKKYKEMKEASVELQRMAINVSMIQIKQKELVDVFLSILSQYDLEPFEIEIEITERIFMENTENNIKILQKFREYGFSISIDDFGTGYSSISYLKRLPIDTLKIDKSFVDGIGLGNQQDDAIVDAIVALAKTLDYTIVAEGIETKKQEMFMENHGCNIGQGYLFSKALKIEDIIRRYGGENGVENKGK